MHCQRTVAAHFVLAAITALVSSSYGQTQLTINANRHYSIGGVSRLDREQYFVYVGTLTPPGNSNLGDLPEEIWSNQGLNTSTGRVSTELASSISNGLPEDPNRPGFYDPVALRNKLQLGSNPDQRDSYRAFVTGKRQDGSDFPSNLSWVGARWEVLREADNPILVTSGRNGGQWPDFLDGGTSLPTSHAGYADFLNIYLEETLYGTGPNQGFLPISPDRFYIEIVNEPNWPSPSQSDWNQVIQLHQTVTELVKEQYPQAKLGGPSCCDGLGSGINGWDRTRQLMDDMTSWQTPSGDPVELDFWTIHPYERYDVQNDGSWEQRVFTSPGHVDGIMDLYETYSYQKFGDPKAFAMTEYGSFNQANSAGNYGSYARDLQQWDLVRDIKEKMLVFMDRPDRIITAVPFVAARHWQNATPTNPEGDNVLFEQDSSGNWRETIVGNMFRMFAPIEGNYLEVDVDSPDFQSAAFRDGDKVYVILNNLEATSQSINLDALTGLGNVTDASWSRIYRSGGSNQFLQDVDVLGTWQNLTLEGEGGAVLTLTVSGPQLYDLATNKTTYYGDDTLAPLTLPSGRSKVINIDADTTDAIFAQVRVGFNRENAGANGEEFDVFVNGNRLTVPQGVLAYDDNDREIQSRTLDVPVSMLLDGNNEVYADFVGNGGELVTAVLLVTNSIGDFSGNGVFDGEDLSLLVDQFGPTIDDRYDLLTDGTIDMDDVTYWLESLRGTSVGLGDFDLDDDIDSDDLAMLQTNYGIGTHYGQGDLDFDGDVDGADYLLLQQLLGSAGTAASANAALVPEPNSILLAISAILIFAGTGGRAKPNAFGEVLALRSYQTCIECSNSQHP